MCAILPQSIEAPSRKRVTACDQNRQTRPGSAKASDHRDWRARVCRRLGDDLYGQDPCALRGERREQGPAISERPGQGMDNCRVRDASALHQHPHEPREPDSRTHSRDSTAHRALAPGGRGHGTSGRAHPHNRLRRHSGRWRNSHCRDHRSVRGFASGVVWVTERRLSGRTATESGSRRRQCWNRRWSGPTGPLLRRGFPRRD